MNDCSSGDEMLVDLMKKSTTCDGREGEKKCSHTQLDPKRVAL